VDDIFCPSLCNEVLVLLKVGNTKPIEKTSASVHFLLYKAKLKEVGQD
jgi:hypothetical protein